MSSLWCVQVDPRGSLGIAYTEPERGPKVDLSYEMPSRAGHWTIKQSSHLSKAPVPISDKRAVRVALLQWRCAPEPPQSRPVDVPGMFAKDVKTTVENVLSEAKKKPGTEFYITFELEHIDRAVRSSSATSLPVLRSELTTSVNGTERLWNAKETTVFPKK